MAQNSASPQIRNMTDMTDAQAQDAMKRAIQIDALADAELAEADKMVSRSPRQLRGALRFWKRRRMSGWYGQMRTHSRLWLS